jgi:hypothetical protein
MMGGVDFWGRVDFAKRNRPNSGRRLTRTDSERRLWADSGRHPETGRHPESGHRPEFGRRRDLRLGKSVGHRSTKKLEHVA